MGEEQASGREFSAIGAPHSGSSNGTGTAVETPPGAAEPRSGAIDVAGATDPERPTDPAGVVEPAGAVEAAEAVDGSNAVQGAAATDAAASVDTSDTGHAGLVEEFARAMHEAAAAVRERVGQDIDGRRKAHLERVETRRKSEASRMHELADEDRASIGRWVEAEQQRIKTERERRTTTLEEDLKASLAEHTTKFEREVEAVEAAITAHRLEVDGFFASIDQETDPVRIAQQATSRPTFPDLAAVSPVAIAASEAAPEPVEAPVEASIEPDSTPVEPIGVMDPEPVARPAGSWIAPGEVMAQAGAIEADASETDEPSGSIPVAVTSGRSTAGPEVREGLLQSTAVTRPMSWLRRDRDQGDH